MLGKKCSLAPLKEELRKQGVSKVDAKTTSQSFSDTQTGHTQYALHSAPLSAHLRRMLIKQ